MVGFESDAEAVGPLVSAAEDDGLAPGLDDLLSTAEAVERGAAADDTAVDTGAVGPPVSVGEDDRSDPGFVVLLSVAGATAVVVAPRPGAEDSELGAAAKDE